MGKEELIISFRDTFDKSNSGNLKQRTERAIASNCVYKEGFISTVKHRIENASVEVYSGTTFEIAKQYASLGRTAVLNFANPENPDGGVQFGAMAQEECLCRSSNLFACISNRNVFDEYYEYHRNLKNHFYTDRLIYTKNVTVFKDDNPIPQMLPEKDWFDVDVITCAAPYLGGSKYTNLTVLRHLFRSRITNILEAALDNCVDTIVLGAFGCGAFKNPAQLVAEEFQSVIENGQYCKKFKNIVFAIKKESENDCGDNYRTFATVLRFPLTENCPVYDLPEVILPTGKMIEKTTVRFHRLPANTTIEDVKELVVAGEGLPETYNNNTEAFEKQRRFLRWQRNNSYYKKQFSVLGDSISTLDGYNPAGYKVFYENDNCVKSRVTAPQNTWWGKIIEYFGGELLVNNSWSGSRVTKLPGHEQLFPSGCSDERTSVLHINNVKPDVIIVYLGTNDWAFGAKTGNETRILDEDEHELFDEAYSLMLHKLKLNYPDAEIWCCTLCETYMSNRPDFKFPHKYAGTHIEEYNDIIREAVGRYGCRLIDLYQYKIPYDSIDGSHPNKAGMNSIATMMIRSMGGPEADSFLDCEDGKHDYKIVEEYKGGTKYVCRHCGKTVHISTMASDECKNNSYKEVLEMEQHKNMERKINWYSGCYDEIELVYDKADGNLIVAAILTELETMALREAEESCGMLKMNNKPITREMFLEMSEENREAVMYYLSDTGLQEFVPSMTEGKITVTFAPHIQKVLGCTMFSVLNRLEKLDGAFNVMFPKATLELRVPLGAKKGMMKYEMLIMKLYPWLSITETSTNTVSSTLNIQPESEVKSQATETAKSQTNTVAQPEERYVGKTIDGKYEVLKLIGRGGFYTTYLVKNIHDNKVWAMKVCDKTRQGYSLAIRENIFTEPYMMQKLDHPAIPKVIDIIEDEDSIFIVRDYIEGETLETIARMYGAQPVEKVVEWSKQMCSTLGYLHSQNPPLIYRDMKPHNIILMADGTLKFIDFGIMRTYKPNQKSDTCCLGTKGYAAPEQFGGSQTDARTDIFGLGMTMFRLVTGIDPTDPPYEIKPICSVNPNLPKGLEYIISKCIRPNPAERYQSCDELMLDLNNYLNLPKPKGIIGKLFGKK